MSTINPNMSDKELRKFGLLTAAMLLLFFDILIPLIWGIAMPVWPLVPAAVLAFLALTLPGSLKSFYAVWMKFATVLGWVNTRIILSLIFFLVFVPAGLVMRIFSDPMRRKMDAESGSYREQSQQPKSENMERPF